MYLTNTQVSVKNFDNFILIRSRDFSGARPCMFQKKYWIILACIIADSLKNIILLFTKSEREIKKMMKNLGKYMREGDVAK
jgi:hypothetical protein